MVLKDDDPPALRDCSPAAQRVFDVLEEADDALSKHAIARETRHTESTVRTAIAELREHDLVSGWGWPRRYRVSDDRTEPDT